MSGVGVDPCHVLVRVTDRLSSAEGTEENLLSLLILQIEINLEHFSEKGMQQMYVQKIDWQKLLLILPICVEYYC